MGDRIVLLKNDKRLGVNNGDTARITEISRTQLTMAYDDGRVVTIDPRRYAKFAHGWAVTIHKSQGCDERNVVLLGDAGMSVEMLHVGLSRATHHVRAYFSRETYADASAVAERVAQRMRTKRSAVDFERVVAQTGGPETAWARRVRAAITDKADPYRRAHAANNRARKQTVDALIGGLVQWHRMAVTQAPQRRAALERRLASETAALLEEHRPRSFVKWTIANRQRIEREAVARDATLARRERARDAGHSPQDTVRARPERELVGIETMRILERDPYGLGSETLVVRRWDEAAGKAVVADHPPIGGDVELGELHVVAAFSDGTYEVDDARTRQARETLARLTKPEQSVERGRGGRSR